MKSTPTVVLWDEGVDVKGHAREDDPEGEDGDDVWETMEAAVIDSEDDVPVPKPKGKKAKTKP
jgi:hypothetical protein